MVRFQTSRGGASVDLNPTEIKTLTELVLSDKFARGDVGTFVGRGSNIFKAGGFILSEAKRKQFQAGQASLAGRLKVAGFTPVLSKGGRVIGSRKGEQVTILEGFEQEAQKKLDVKRPQIIPTEQIAEATAKRKAISKRGVEQLLIKRPAPSKQKLQLRGIVARKFPKVKEVVSKIETKAQAFLDIGKPKRDLEKGIFPQISKTTDILSKKFFQLSEKISKKTGFEKFIQDKPVVGFKVPKESAEAFVSDFLKFSFFNPAFSTAATGRFETIGKQLKKKPKITLDDVSSSFEKSFQKGDKNKIANDLKNLLNTVKNQRDPKLKEQGIKNLKLLLDDLNKKKILPDFAFNTKTGSFKPLSSFEKQAGITRLAPEPTFDVNIVIDNIPKLRGVQTISTVTARFGTPENVNIVERELQKNQDRIDRAQISLGERFIISQKVIPKLGSAQRNLQKERQILKTLQTQKVSQRVIQRQILKIGTIQKTIQKLRTTQKTLKIPKFKLPPKKLRIPLPFPFFGDRRKRKILPPIKKLGEGYFAFVKQEKGKKFIKLNKEPASKKRARDVMAWFMDQTLSASGKIKLSKLPAKKLKLNIPNRYFISTQNKYREFRIKKGKVVPTPNSFIEKRGKRLDTIRERKKIKVFAELSRLRKQKLKFLSPIKFKRV